MAIGDKIKELRNSNNLTQREFAKIFNVNYSTLAMWEINKNEPDIETINKLAEYFNVSTDYLLGRTDEWGNVTQDAPQKRAKQKNKNKDNHVTLICRGGDVVEYDLPPEDMELAIALLDKIRERQHSETEAKKKDKN